ncbi:PIN domain-containing protein [Mesorhizobium sp.]|uniref:PIN domain-containing protein n=1 Tax=Mesorhizobium sp. TaxID=1871066 RepID=UPI00338D8545
MLGEAVHESVQRIEKLFAAARLFDAVKLRAAQRAVDKRAPFHKDKNSIDDGILIEIYGDILSAADEGAEYAFVTHNKHDFSNR